MPQHGSIPHLRAIEPEFLHFPEPCDGREVPHLCLVEIEALQVGEPGGAETSLPKPTGRCCLYHLILLRY